MVRGKYGDLGGGWCTKEVREGYGMGCLEGTKEMVADS